ncbi:hypothetical protein [Nocardioides panaciterrulae]|uniref:Lipoprotein n=1 Tax=Nocardioides panaciterrulae TaxID=661492 RepID=A0A7Y9E6P3_9ACTN|nr:hypothetical protein [Nocardioides panaciterrulae]NYD42208.1 hypothetical protein [Nocardioides panaciterrulae]
MKTTRAPRLLAASSLLLVGVLLAGCDDGSSSDSNDAAGSGDATGNPTSMAVPSGAANPFSATFTGPEHGKPGQTLTETLTNTGRLPDFYQVLIAPADAATVKNPDLHLSPGESAKVRIQVRSTPFDVQLKSVGGGNPEVVAMTVH